MMWADKIAMGFFLALCTVGSITVGKWVGDQIGKVAVRLIQRRREKVKQAAKVWQNYVNQRDAAPCCHIVNIHQEYASSEDPERVVARMKQSITNATNKDK